MSAPTTTGYAANPPITTAPTQQPINDPMPSAISNCARVRLLAITSDDYNTKKIKRNLPAARIIVWSPECCLGALSVVYFGQEVNDENSTRVHCRRIFDRTVGADVAGKMLWRRSLALSSRMALSPGGKNGFGWSQLD
jgi:hypothetical protein